MCEPRTFRCTNWLYSWQYRNCMDHRKSKRIPEKISTAASLTTLKTLTVWITTNCGKFLKRWEYQTTLSVSWKNCMQVKKQQLELDMEKQTASKSGKENVKAVCCHPACLTSMQSTSCEKPGWMKHKLESRLPGENINNLRYAANTTLMAESKEELKSLLRKWRREWKSWLKIHHSVN